MRNIYRLTLLAVILAAIIAISLPVAAPAAGSGQSRKIVVFDTIVNRPAQEAIVRGVGGALIKPLPMLNGAAVVLPETAERALANRAGVVRVDDDLVIYATAKGGKNPPPPPPQIIPWGIQTVNAPTAWAASAGAGVKVAVVDTGVQLNHPDLAANIAGGYNAINPAKSATDGNGHGTHVAGIIAAVNNSIGVVGVAPQARIYSVRVLNNSGTGWLSDIIEGLTWCLDNDIKVVNMSLGSSSGNLSFQTAISLLYSNGITIVAAAGNNGGGYGTGTGSVDYPGAYPEVIAVSATDSNDDFAVFSSAGPEVDLAAPGQSVYSTYKGSGYATMSGTSMASPHVAAVAALRLALHPTESPEQVKAALQSTATDIGLTSDQQGAGLVNAYGAVSAP